MEDQDDIARFTDLDGVRNNPIPSIFPPVSLMNASNIRIPGVDNHLSMAGVYSPPITRQGARNLSMSGGGRA